MTLPIPGEVIDAAEQIKGSQQRVMLAPEIRRCLLKEDGRNGHYRNFPFGLCLLGRVGLPS